MVAAAATWPHDSVLHAYWAEPGRLLAGEYPGSRDPELAVRKIAFLIDAGIHTIVDLTTADEGLSPYVRLLRDAEKATGRPVRYMPRPVPDMRILNQAGYDLILEDIAEALADGDTVYVHCWKGIGRTGTVIGCRLIDAGLTYPSAISRIAQLRAGTRKAHLSSPESSAQHHVLQERARRREGSR